MARFCGECGSALEEGTRVCGECGTPVAAAASATPIAEAPPVAPTMAALPSPAPTATAPTAAAEIATVTARYSGFWRRLFAYLLDAVLLNVVLRFTPTSDAVNAGIALLYFLGGWAAGGTLGMRLLGIRLVDAEGKMPGPVRALRRLLGVIVAVVPFGLGLLWIAADRRKQGWHDKIAGTFATRGAFAPAAATTAARGGRSPLVVALLVLLVLFFGATAAGAYYIVSPDLPGGPLAALPDFETLRYDLPLIGVSHDPLPPIDPAVKARFDQARTEAIAAASADPSRVREAAVMTTLRSAGLPVTAVHVVTAADGKQAMVVALDYQRLASASSSAGVGEGYDALTSLSQNKALSTQGLGYLTVAAQDTQGRTLFDVSAPATAIDGLRSGQLTRSQFIGKVAFRGESRAGLVQAIADQIGAGR